MKQMFTRLWARAHGWKPAKASVGLLAAACLGSLGQAHAQQYFIKDDFRTNSTATFRVGGNATLLGTSSTDQTGYLRLTTSDNNQKGFAISKQTFNPATGFSISFEYFSYGGSFGTDNSRARGDGINMFLIDGTIVTDAANFVPGGYGGSLGYAQLGTSPITAGATGGFIGIGFDEFGGYSWNNEAKNGGTTGRVISGVAIRGAGNASTTAYPYLTGTATGTYSTTHTLTSGFGIDVATARAQPGTTDYRRVFVDVFPVSKGSSTYKVTVRIQNGPSTISTVIDNYTFTSATQVMPSSLRIGFAASTGGSTNFHEVRDLQIVKPPVANDDAVQTAYNRPVTFDVLANDEASGSALDPTALDLDPTTVAINRTLTVPQGRFDLTSDNQVTFTPSGTFSGTFTVPYTVQSILKSISNQGTITMTVTGADIATAINGPTAINTGTTATYTTTTTNVGVETGTSVVPKLTLTGNITLNPLTGGATSTTSGTGTAKVTTITFPTITSLATTDAPVNNAVTFTLLSGSVTGVSTVTSSVPDPDPADNTATLTTTGYALTSIASGCGTPGKDGPGPSTKTTSDGIVNTYYAGQTSVAVGAKSITLAGGATGYATPIVAGDLVLIMQMQGATVTPNNNNTYATSNITAGTYEYAVAAPTTNVTAAGGGTLVLVKGLTNAYTAASLSGNVGPQRFQVIRVPQFSSFDASKTTTTGAAWNGSTGGVLVLDVVGVTTFGSTANSTSFTMTGKGYRGGGGVRYTGNATYAATDYVRPAGTKDGAGAHGSKGEGLAGTPRYVSQTATAALDLGTDNYPGGSVGRGAPGNAGGGGTDALPSTGNIGSTGGGGGSNASNADNGGNGGGYNTGTTGGGIGAVAPGLTDDSRLFMGGGGGAGSTPITGTEGSGSGGSGGGVVILRTGTVAGTGTITTNGASAGNNTANTGGGGGGGAGGAVLLASNGSMTGITINANGGDGGSTPTTANPSQGAGGGGSGGVIYNNATSTNVDPATTTVVAGARGSSRAGANGGATAGTAGPTAIRSTAQDAGISGTTGCRPSLSASLRTTKPQFTRTAGMKTSYTLTIVNSGGAAASIQALVTLGNGTSSTTGGSATGTANALFKYSATTSATMTLPDNTTVNLSTAATNPDAYVGPAAGATSPSFSGLDVPAGAIVTITFDVDVDQAVVSSLPYQSGVQLTYLDPTRTAATTTITPGGTYAGSGTVAGSNYMSTSTTNEDVMLVAPLPVVLTRFSALAVRQDASLSWTTASEVNSDHFDIERSLDGKTFELVASVKAQGFSSHEQRYSYVNANAARWAGSALAYYRLRQVDQDEASSYSPVQAVRFEKGAVTAISLYPNPAQNQAALDLSSLPAGTYQVQILDLTGRVLSQYTLAGQQVHTLSLAPLSTGAYLVQVTGASQRLTLPLLHQ